MSSNLLQLVQQFALETGLIAKPTVVASSGDDAVLQAMALLNAVGYEITREHQWEWISKQNIINTVATSVTGDTVLGSSTISNTVSAGIDTTYQISGTGINQATFITAVPDGAHLTLSQPATATATGTTFQLSKVSYAMPSDFDRQIDSTHWDKSKHWQMLGPETAQQWEWLLSGYISTGPRIRYRILGGNFQIWPMVTANEVLGFEYMSNAWALSVSGASQTSFIADTDTCVFPDRLMVLGLKKKMWEIKGFDTAAIERDYTMHLNIAKANDAGSQTLSMAPRISELLISYNQIPDSGYGS
jgi:hypothetical protein